MIHQIGYVHRTVIINHQVYSYYWITKPHVKNLQLKINQFLQIIVTSPPQVSLETIEQFVVSHANKIAQFWQYQTHWTPFNLKTQMIRFFGQEFCLLIKLTNQRNFNCYFSPDPTNGLNQNFHFVVPSIYSDDLVKQTAILTKWFRQIATKYLSQRLKEHCQRLGIVTPKLIIRTMVKKWGWCNLQKVICFNTWLVCCSWDVIDYVICHELAHLTHLNHNKAFWQLLATYYPNYQLVLKKLTFRLD